jgi:hypothetical protein
MPMRSLMTVAVLVALWLPPAAHAQSDPALSVRVPSLSQLAARRAQGLGGYTLAPIEFTLIRPSDQIRGAPVANQGYYRRTDWELGRAFIGSALGLTAAYFFNQIIHYESDFSKGNPLLKQDRNGEVVYNVLLYGGISPYFALRGIQSVRPYGGNPTAAYFSGVVGTLLGMVYWTSTDTPLSVPGIAVTCLLTAITTTIGYNRF